MTEGPGALPAPDAPGGPARLLAVMGSGETTPTMVKLHRELFAALGPPPVAAVLLDTPYGFQRNAADISARAVAYFKESVGRPVEVAALPRSDGATALALEAALARVAEARWVFSGPGSPTYALRQWRPTVLPRLLGEKLARGGCVVFASAAALTLGRFSVPVYEIYKAGSDPAWAEGLDLLGPYGIHAAVIPHYDNAEGGTHDTRFCYLGEERLAIMEEQLPTEAWVLGVDEHTACVFDFAAATVTTAGLGMVTVRRRGRSATIGAGTTLSVEDLVGLAFRRSAVRRTARSGACGPGVPAPGRTAASPLLSEVERLSTEFDCALARGDAGAATEAVLLLEAALHAWSADTSDEFDSARAALRRMVVRLGEAAVLGLRDPREAAAPWVEALLSEREEARQGRRYADADRIRDNLRAAGVEVRDAPAGTEWYLRETLAPRAAG